MHLVMIGSKACILKLLEPDKTVKNNIWILHLKSKLLWKVKKSNNQHPKEKDNSIKSAPNLRKEHRVILREAEECKILKVSKICTQIQSVAILVVEKLDVQTSLLDIHTQQRFSQDTRKISRRNWRKQLLLGKEMHSIWRRRLRLSILIKWTKTTNGSTYKSFELRPK